MNPLFYILIGVAWFIYQVIRESRKLKRQAQEQAQNIPGIPPIPEVTKKRPDMVNRETILKKATSARDEFKQKENRVKQEPKHLQKKHSKVYTSDRESQSLEMIISEADEAIKYESTQRAALADEHLSPYAHKVKGANKYAALLKNPQSLKTAFVLSEILKPKY